MSLSEQSRQITEAFIASQPEHVQGLIQNAFSELMHSSIGEYALTIGDKAMDFTLPNARGGHTSLQTLLNEGPVVLSFYRGGWCPFCNLEFKALQNILPQIRTYGASLVGISPELPDASMETVERHRLEFEVLSDVGNQIAFQYGLLMGVHRDLQDYYLQWGFNLPELNGDHSFKLPIPATYVIDRDATIVAAYINKDYTQRMEPEAILQALKTLV